MCLSCVSGWSVCELDGVWMECYQYCVQVGMADACVSYIGL